MALQENAVAGPTVLTWESLGAYQILSTVDDVSGVERFVQKQLGPLFQYDAQKHSDLVETLCRYLESGCNHANAAQALIVHRNTLKYRLDRIREIAGCDLADPDTRFNLQLATRGWQLLKAFGRWP
jgi:DNA-binding PucR family transcriptional regulator